MLLDPFWHVFCLVDGCPSADFITLWESLRDNIPKYPMDVQHKLPLSGYQENRGATFAVMCLLGEQLPKYIFGLLGRCKTHTPELRRVIQMECHDAGP
jgi:hypothetical protein